MMRKNNLSSAWRELVISQVSPAHNPLSQTVFSSASRYDGPHYRPTFILRRLATSSSVRHVSSHHSGLSLLRPSDPVITPTRANEDLTTKPVILLRQLQVYLDRKN